MTDPNSAAAPPVEPAGAPASTAANQALAAIEPLLARQLARLRRRYLWHGIGLTALITAAAIALFFALDHGLRLPLPIRLLHTTAILTLAGYCFVRFVRYPLTRRFANLDLASWIERTFPELGERLVSTVQLRDAASGDLRNQSSAMIDQMVAETVAATERLPFERLFDDRKVRRPLLLGGGLVAVLATLAVLYPTTARAFVLRHLGFQAQYPRQTTLVVELPPAGPELQRTDRDGTTELLLPAGADLHVSVLASGTVPKEVFLDVIPLRSDDAASAAARSITMAQRPGDRFRYVFRRLSGNFTFHARGGDDEDGDLMVVVRTLHPPQVATVQATITPPAYTGAEVAVQNGGAIEALAGSQVALALATTMPVRTATMVFLESGRRIELQPNAPADDSGAAATYHGAFAVETSDRYQVELVADNGLRNPDPGTYPIAVLQDYTPVGHWLLPDDETALLLPDALLCVRVDAHDDFGLRAIDLAIDRSGTRALDRPLLATPPPAGDRPVFVTELIEVKDLLGGTQNAASEGLVLQVTLRDNRAPEPGVTELPRRIVQIVDAPQLSAAIGKLFRTLREDIAQALEIQSDRRQRLEDAAAKQLAGIEFAQLLTGVEVGQSRVAASCERTHRGLMRAFDLHLWNRIETSQHAAEVVDLYRAWSLGLREPLALDPAFYRDLIQRRAAGTLGAMETTLDPILQMIGLADRAATTDCTTAAKLVAEAQVARDAAASAPLLVQAIAAQQRIETGLQQLLLRLEEWNDFQDLVQETRALRDRQRDLQMRTEEAKGSK